MYQLLIVDDEIHAVRGVISSVEWDKLGISSVHSAYNIRKAKEIFRNHTIDIMICDIEMPQGNGLELLAWVKENYPSVVSAFLTCHADFKYARKAVQLGVMDYMLKPVDPIELEAIMKKAIEAIEKRKELDAASETYRHYYRLWSSHKRYLIERFWINLLDRKFPSNFEAVKNALMEFDVDYNESIKFVPVLASVKRWHMKQTAQDEKETEDELQNEMEKIFIKTGRQGHVIVIKTGIIFAILPVDDSGADNTAMLRKDCQAIIDIGSHNFQCDISCYIGSPAAIHVMPDILDTLVNLDINNVTANIGIFFTNGQDKAPEPVKLPVISGWSEMFIDGERERVYLEIDRSFDILSRVEGLNVAALNEFYQNFMQIVYYVLQKKGLQSHQVFSPDQFKEQEQNAIRTVTGLRDWVKQIACKVLDSVREKIQSQSVVEKVKQHITEHLNDELSREEIANCFHMSPDYLTRIFKRETGLSISEFLVQERIKLAKSMLINTNMPISDIVSFIGYSNFSHFSKIFKKATNFNPLEFRKQKQSK